MSAAMALRRRWAAWIPAVTLMATIFVLSSQPGLAVSEDPQVDRPIRFMGHLVAFGTLAAAFLVALGRGARPGLRQAVIAFGLTVLYGLLDEWHQSLVPDRNGRLDDVVTDAIGALMGLALAWIALAVRSRSRADPVRGESVDG